MESSAFSWLWFSFVGGGTSLNRVVAIKSSTAKSSDRFESEAAAIAALDHPNIGQFGDVGPDYLVTEYVEGQPLKGRCPQHSLKIRRAQPSS